MTRTRSVGYSALIEMFAIKTLPHYRESYILDHGTPHIERDNHEEKHYYPRKYFLKDFQDPLNHLEFALKYDGINLEILLEVFKKLDPKILEAYITSQPTSKFGRKIWYLYEFLTDNKLKLKDACSGTYTPLLDPKEYYTATSVRSRRHYIDDNLLGNRHFCPIIGRTQKLKEFEKKNFAGIANQLMQQYDSSIIARAVNFLYFKETMSSYEIEKEKPDPSRAHRFVEALKKADHIGAISQATLIELQNMIVDPRYANKSYRDFQNYIGTQTRLDAYTLSIDYFPPKPEDVPEMMQGLLDSLERMIKSQVHPVIIAAAISFGFVFIHPFEDGNGRLHRFLMHYIFARTGFVPKGVIFPLSAVILKEMASYHELLESLSKPILNLIGINYEFDKKGMAIIKEETSSYYRYIDYTRFAKYLFKCIEQTVYTDFKKEINYLLNYDKTKKTLQEIVDMPDGKLNLFIQLVLQNRGTLSAKKRESHFSILTDEEIESMEEVIQTNMSDELK